MFFLSSAVFDRINTVINQMRYELLSGLSSNVTASNQTFMRAVSVGLTVNDQFGVLVSRRDSLVQVAESGTNQPSYLLHTQEANGWSAEANVRSNPVNNGARVLIDQVNRLEQKVLFINRSAEEAGILLPQAFDMGAYHFMFDMGTLRYQLILSHVKLGKFYHDLYNKCDQFKSTNTVVEEKH